MNFLDELFVGGAVLVTAGLIAWGWAVLPGEGWQILAVIPRQKRADGRWSGLNLTFYGFFQALAVTSAFLLLLLMMGALEVPLWATASFTLPLLSLSLPAASLVARRVEKKPATLTVAGAFFVGLLAAPPLLWLMNHVAARPLPLTPMLAALATAYCLGEGLGRLACISFGCCYGRPLESLSPRSQRLFQGLGLVFTGQTKKACYEGGLAGREVVPVQCLTSVVLCAAAMASLYFFLKGHFAVSLWVSIGVSQVWRVYSESLRADWRGGGKLSAYQYMSLIALAYGGVMPVLDPWPAPTFTQLALGLESLWRPEVLLGLSALWAVVFLYTGRSQTTGATVELNVVQEKI